ncbi:metalloregulator ArsR/SmtB family transcription factor [bacterium]|nr:metalloregulator ArsR/SmtB family transcription factor [bacterium]
MKNKRNKKPPMSEEVLDLVAQKFKILSEPLRLAIVQLLMSGEMNVTDLHTELNCSQPNVSKHLKMLEQAGYVKKEKHGVSVYYSIADKMVFQLCDLVCNSLSKEVDEQSRSLKKLKKMI